MRTRAALVAVMAGIVSAGVLPAAGQQPQQAQTPVFRTRTDLVEVDAVVIGADGRPIAGLTAADFTLLDRSRPQQIAAFEEVSHARTAAPLLPPAVRLDVADNTSARATRLIVIGLDDLHVQGKTQELKDMARKVVHGIGTEASLALVTTSGRFGVEPTADRSLLLRELDAFLDTVDPEGRRNAKGQITEMPVLFGAKGPSDLGRFFAGMSAYKTMEDVAEKIGEGDTRRKAMIWISGGPPGPSVATCANTVRDTDNHNCMAVASVLNELRRSNVVTYTVPTGDFSGASLRDLAAGSGGFMIRMQDFDRDLNRLLDDLDHYYLLGFYPDKTDGNGYRELEVRVNRPGAVVRARKGYRPGPPPQPPKNRNPLAQLSAGVLPKTDLALRLAATPLPSASRDRTDVILTLDVRSDDGPRIAPGTTAKEVLKYSVWAVDLRKKKPVANVSREARVTLSPAEKEDDRAREVRFQVQTRLSLPPGRYQIRASASSTQLKRSGSVYLDTDVPSFAREPLAIGSVVLGYADGPRIFALDSPQVTGLLPFEPTLDREFDVGDRLRVHARVGGTQLAGARTTLELRSADDVLIRAIDAPVSSGRLTAELALTDLAPGGYILRAALAGPASSVARELGFIVRDPQ
jgi:VWFA-related protein